MVRTTYFRRSETWLIILDIATFQPLPKACSRDDLAHAHRLAWVSNLTGLGT